jgi:formylglycine-generating enzyme required for sulfatase activity
MAYAFCIWDNGFLPSETEWNYAASGGSQQRVYPWSVPSTSAAINCSDSDYQACADTPALVGIYTNGYGRYGQADLAGGEWEWTLDYFDSYQNPCNDCAFLSDPGTNQRNLRGASWNYTAQYLYSSYRLTADPTIHFSNDGFRCARPP